MQTTTDCKGHEGEAARNLITYAPNDLGGAVITADALHLQNETMELAREHNAHMLVGLRGNHGNLLKSVEKQFNALDADGILAMPNVTADNSHGRIEVRETQTCAFESPDHPLLQTAIKVKRTRQDIRRGHPVGKPTCDISYYTATFTHDMFNQAEVGVLVRNHWAVENKLHHVKDRTMKEDRCRAKDAVAANMALIRSVVVNLRTISKKQGGILAKSLKGCASMAIVAMHKSLLMI